MALITITSGVVGMTGVKPSILFIDTTDDAAVITAAGYLNSAKSEGISIPNNSAALVSSSDQGTRWYQVNIAPNGTITLAAI